MAQFGGKNPPWAREVVGQPGVAMVGGLGQQVLTQPGVATPTVYSLGNAQAQHQFNVQQAGVARAQLQAAAALQQSVQLPQPGIAIPTTLATTQVATVSYPAPRVAAQGPQPKQRVFTGTVTKLHDNFGFVDEDVFFQTSCVKGNIPKVGDRVLVEAAYNANMPFKWNATRIQVLPNQPPPGSNPPVQQQQQQQIMNHQPQQRLGPGITPSAMGNQPPPLMGQAPPQGMGPPGGRSGRNRDNQSRYNDRERERERERDRPPHRERRSPPRRRSRSPRRRSRSPRSPSRSESRRSPPRSRRPPRVVPRYTVQVPKLSLDVKEANVIAVKSRYANMYIPSDFFNAAFSWTDAFPLHRPLQLGNACNFHVMHKEVDPMTKQDAVLEPPDADHLYSAKVMLMSSPMLEDLYHKSCALAEDPTDLKEGFQHPTRLIQFLVGLKGKSEPMAIGGPWSPNLDGPSPSEDPSVLIKTAIRTTLALTGIDLSVCTQWYRFAEIRYHRPEEVHKGRVVPARVETVVIFLPDVWSCNPSRLEWEQMTVSFKNQLAEKISDENKEETQDEEEGEGEDGAQEKADPTHFADLDPKTMKVNDLRKELEARSLSSKGLKSQLIARLTKALKTEQEAEEQEAENKEDEDEKPPQEEEKMELDDKEEERKRREDEEKKRRDERERAARERRYTLPENPAILVHPSTTAKGGKFDCTVMSLSVLLDYRPDDNKEHTFEVSLFAELFNEMLMRDSGFQIYKAMVMAPEKPKEEKEDKHKKDKDRKDDKDKKDKDDKDKRSDKDKKSDKDDKDKKEDKEKTKKDDKEEKEEEKSEKKDSGDGEEPPTKKRKSSDDHDEKDGKKEDSKDEKKDSKKKDDDDDGKDDEKDEDDDDAKSTSTDTTKRDRDRRRSRDKDRDREKEKEKKKEKVKYYTANPCLLLAFVYFDQSHTGYLLDKDVEEILHTIGLHLSRAQVKKLVQKLVTRDTLNYRKITDKPRPEKEKKEEEKKEGEGEQEEEPKEAVEGDASLEGESEVLDDEALSLGNRPLLSTPKKDNIMPPTATPPANTRSKRGKKDDQTEVVQQGMIMYKGAVLDINSIMQRLDKSEKTKRDTESKLKDTQEEMEMLKSSFNSSEQNSQKVALELQELKKKLRDQRKATERGESDAKKYYETLARTKGPLSSLLQDIRDCIGGEASVKSEVKTEVNGD